MAEQAFPISQWTEAGATSSAPWVTRSRAGHSASAASTAIGIEVSTTIGMAPFLLLYNCTIYALRVHSATRPLPDARRQLIRISISSLPPARFVATAEDVVLVKLEQAKTRRVVEST